jgi:hypothetical protein
VLNSSTISLNFSISEPIESGDILIIQPDIYPNNAVSFTPLAYKNYSIPALPSKVCDSKCNPIVTPNVSASQTASSGATALAGTVSSLMNGANLGIYLR